MKNVKMPIISNLLAEKIQRNFFKAVEDIAYPGDLTEEKIERLIPVFEKFYKTCYQMGIDPNLLINPTISKLLILPANKEYIYCTNIDKKVQNLKEVLNSREHGNDAGVSEEDVSLILNYVFDQVTTNECIDYSSRNGDCEDYIQALTMLPLMETGLKCTINRVSDFPNITSNHPFSTVTFPVVVGDKVVAKTYLIDLTYPKFFTIAGCNRSNFLFGHPDTGYFTCQTEIGRKFAAELITKGYVELTESNAEIYINGFEMAYFQDSIIANNNGEKIIKTINSSKRNVSYDMDVIELETGSTLSLPTLNVSKND